MKNNVELKVVEIQDTQIATILACKGFHPGLFEAGTENQCWWFCDEPGLKKELNRINLSVNSKEYKEMFKRLNDFIEESIAFNNQCDLGQPE